MTAALATGALTLTACGSRDDGKSDSGAGDTTTVVIGVDAPLTGDLSALGVGIHNSADLAAKQANSKKYVDGVTFKVEALDDQAQPSSGQTNASKFVADKDVLGAVGPLNSNVAESMQKVFADGNLVEVSPATTNPSLSQGQDWNGGTKKRPYASFFRTCTTDAVQGPFGAQYLYNKAKRKSVFVIDDKKTYGAGLAGTFKAEFAKLGGKIAGTEHINPDTKDFSAVVTKVKSSGADLVYYGGEYPAGGPLSKQLKSAGVDAPVAGGDALDSDEFIKLAGGKNDGDFATSVGLPIEKLDSAKEFISAYKKAGYKDPYETYGGYAYDSTWSVVEAVKKVVDGNDGKLPDDAREQVAKAMQDVSFDGVTGAVSFDKYGDTTNKQLTVYQVKSGLFTPVESGKFGG
ncbi:branched-chain amino acid ABC transporter substrate-binding protein [Streptomyces sp. NPDC050560]|uniref:branched-chain amino acid ABC transporter substrate-binding protein n=1 Tax=Streptomyces sp. NPDC050560 TaxID=3365630 RepID=UPI0037B99657